MHTRLNVSCSKCPPLTAAAMALTAVALAAPQTVSADWLQFARGPQRTSLADALPVSITEARWVLSDHAGAPISFIGQAGVVAHDERIFAPARIGGQPYLVAAHAETGAFLWKALVPTDQLASWSTPAVDAGNGTVLVASGSSLIAIDTVTGSQRWQAMLNRNVVNASPLATTDLGDANRAFITDYDGFGGSGQLYCINIDPFDAAVNPFPPGEIVWSVTLGATSGNTPAYHDGIVYIANISDPTGQTPGQIRAFPATAVLPPEPLWTFTNPAPHGFFGGLSVRADGPVVSIFAATYALYGAQFAANMVKVDGASGQLVWSVPSNRTDATPIPLPDDRIVLSGGIHGFGSIPSVQLFQDNGQSVTMLWDSAYDSWVDLNNNGIMDPGEYLEVGGWTHQPLSAHTATGTVLLAGRIAPQTFNACTDMYVLDLDRQPRDPKFIQAHFAGAGSTPAAAGGGDRIYTIGPAGLHAFGQSTCWANCDDSIVEPILNVDDFTCFINRFAEASSLPHEQQVTHYANCDGSTTAPVLNVDDFMCFINHFASGCP